MAIRPAVRLLLREGDPQKLTRAVHSTSVRVGSARRARIVLLAADGVSNTEIAEEVGATRTTVIAW
jgi:DNA-binding NarL/FixJ family response regulator